LLTEAAVDGKRDDGGLHYWRLLSMEAGWDGGTMMQWHRQQWHLWPVVVAAMAVIVLNCAAAVDAATTILSSATAAAAKTPSPLPPLTAASIGNDCNCHCQ
jgi:hypothetical protein